MLDLGEHGVQAAPQIFPYISCCMYLLILILCDRHCRLQGDFLCLIGLPVCLKKYCCCTRFRSPLRLIWKSCFDCVVSAFYFHSEVSLSCPDKSLFSLAFSKRNVLHYTPILTFGETNNFQVKKCNWLLVQLQRSHWWKHLNTINVWATAREFKLIFFVNYSFDSMWIRKASANHHQTQQWDDRDADICPHFWV